MRRSLSSSPLRHRLFRRLATTYAVNEMGDWMGIIALSVLVFDATGSPLATAGLFLGTRFLPAFLAPLLVARIEKPPPRIVLPLVYCGETAAFGALALLVSNFSLPIVIVIAAIDGSLALASRALTRAVVVSLLEPTGELRSGNAVLNIFFTAGAALGPAFAGLVVAGLGLQTALLLNAASFYLVAWIIFTAGPLPRPEPEEGGTADRVRAGIAYVRSKVDLRRLLLAQGAAFVFFSIVAPIEVIYAKETLGASDTGYGFLLAAWGGGMVAGGLAFAALKRVPLILLLLLSTLAVGVGYLGMAVAPTLLAACIAAVIGGVGNGIQWVAAISAVQELTEPGMQARVMAVLESIGAAMPGVGFALGGALAAVTTPRTTFVVSGLGVLAVVFVILPMARDRRFQKAPDTGAFPLDETDSVVLELLPGGTPIPNSSEVEF